MYTEQDLMQTKTQIRDTSIKIFIMLAVFLVCSIFVAKYAKNALGLIILLVGICLSIFFWGIYGTPVATYYKFLKELFTGRSRLKKARIQSVSNKPVYKDNKLFYYEIMVKEDSDDEIEQMLLFDANKTLKNVKPKEWYEFEVYQNFIIDMKSINE